MRQTTPPGVEYTPLLLDRVTARIAPYFHDGSALFTDDVCRAVARECVLSFRPVTGKELQLVAQLLATGMASLDCLRYAALVPAEQVEAVLRIREDALKLNSLSTKAHRALEARQRERAHGQAGRAAARAFNEAEFNSLMNRVRDMVTFARAKGEASRVVQELESAPPDAPRRKAEEAWAEDLRNVAAWTQQTQH